MKQINEECENLYNSKIQILSMIQNKERKENKIYELKSINDEILEGLSIYLSKFMICLWENPKIVAYLLMKAIPDEILNSLLPLFSNNFFENILSQKFVQKNLLYTITLLLKNEINNYKTILNPKKFLNIQSPSGFLLYELRNKRDFQIFIKEVIMIVVEILGKYNYDLNFEINKINDYINDKFNKIKNINNKISEDKDESILYQITDERIGTDINKLKNMEVIKYIIL